MPVVHNRCLNRRFDPSMKKPTKPSRKGPAEHAPGTGTHCPTHLEAQPRGAIAELERHACLDLEIARLTLGLYETIVGDDVDRLFPGYRWRQRDVGDFPVELRDKARRLLAWGQEPTVPLNDLIFSQLRIKTAVYARRESSPSGQKWIEIAEHIRREHPVEDAACGLFRPAAPATMMVNILPDMIGLPLTGRTLRLVQNFNPASIQVCRHGESVGWGQEPTVVTIQLNPDRYSVEAIAMFVAVPRPVVRPEKIEGELEDFFETGTEGVVWAIQDDENFGYDGLHIIEAGDHLAIVNGLALVGRDRTIAVGSAGPPLESQIPAARAQPLGALDPEIKPDDWARFSGRDATGCAACS